MAAAPNFNRGTVTTPDGTHENISAILRGTQFLVRHPLNRSTIAEATIASYERTDRNTWKIVLEDGTEWTAVKDCGCT